MDRASSDFRISDIGIAALFTQVNPFSSICINPQSGCFWTPSLGTFTLRNAFNRAILFSFWLLELANTALLVGSKRNRFGMKGITGVYSKPSEQ